MSKVHWVALASVPRVGGKTTTRLLSHFGSVSAIFAASVEELSAVPRLGMAQAEAIASLSLNRIEERMSRYEAAGIQLITWEEAGYPANLLLTKDAPLLTVRGTLQPTDSRAVAIVGTRQPLVGSTAFAQRLAIALAERGWTIVSGLALGIDAAAHRGTLQGGGRTLAVLGSGVDAIYPESNIELAHMVSRQGALLAEMLPETRVSRQNLIARNRLTSGLSRAVMVVQSSADSGSANTARRSLSQGRVVLAVTGNEDAHLLDAGAERLDPDDIDFDELSERLDAIELRAQPNEPSQPRLC